MRPSRPGAMRCALPAYAGLAISAITNSRRLFRRAGAPSGQRDGLGAPSRSLPAVRRHDRRMSSKRSMTPSESRAPEAGDRSSAEMLGPEKYVPKLMYFPVLPYLGPEVDAEELEILRTPE